LFNRCHTALMGKARRAEFHALRETFNMLMALRSVDPEMRQLAMRHSDIKLMFIKASTAAVRGAAYSGR
jgi:hypothetical protein